VIGFITIVTGFISLVIEFISTVTGFISLVINFVTVAIDFITVVTGFISTVTGLVPREASVWRDVTRATREFSSPASLAGERRGVAVVKSLGFIDFVCRVYS
jgi:hypothetical protein